MMFLYKTFLDEKQKKKEGWDADADAKGKWQKCQQPQLACPPYLKVN
jgi:hypothetical protein